jgi:hypothetical protein
MKLIVIALSALALAGCASTRPASVAGECGVFRNPGRAVLGKTRQDQQDIDGKWLEPGITSCGWPRPTK